MADVFALLAEFDATQPDGLLVALAGAPGVDERSIVIRSLPRAGGHGNHAVSWVQNGRKCSAEASTLATALDRAVRASGARSASTSPDEPPAEGPKRSIFREVA